MSEMAGGPSPTKAVTFRRDSWQPEPVVTVTLRLASAWTDRWDVFLDDDLIGQVGRYVGSLDRRYAGSRLRFPGKRRTLWLSTVPGHRTNHEYVSRADAIRSLLSAHERH